MDFKQIQELIKLINNSNIGEVSVEQKDFKVTIKQKEEHITQVVAPMQQQARNSARRFSPRKSASHSHNL